MSLTSLIPNLKLTFANCFNLSTQYNPCREPCTHSPQERNRIGTMIDKAAITDRHELT